MPTENQTAPRERPILFNGPMVRAILEGRKTVTRRIMKPQPVLNGNFWELGGAGWSARISNFTPVPGHSLAERCLFGQPGDRLWVRETWGVISHAWDEQSNMVDWSPDRPATPIRELPFGQGYYSGHAIYAADGPVEWAGDDDGGGEPRSAWKPSIHMPRAASRILLEITAVRVERLQMITEEQARAEGITDGGCTNCGNNEPCGCDCPAPCAVDSFYHLWKSTGGDWEANPWVWVIEFKRVISDDSQQPRP